MSAIISIDKKKMENYLTQWWKHDKILEFVFLNIILQRKLLFVQNKFVIFMNSS